MIFIVKVLFQNFFFKQQVWVDDHTEPFKVITLIILVHQTNMQLQKHVVLDYIDRLVCLTSIPKLTYMYMKVMFQS